MLDLLTSLICLIFKSLSIVVQVVFLRMLLLNLSRKVEHSDIDIRLLVFYKTVAFRQIFSYFSDF